MTTIACSREEIAGDRQFTESGRKWQGKTKLFRFLPHPNTFPLCEFIIGFAGAAGAIMNIAEFFTLPDLIKPPRVKGVSGLVLTAKKEIYVFDDYPVSSWIPVTEKYAAIGTGGSIAVGAMSAGLSPLEAVKLASKHDIYTGLGFQCQHF